MFPFPDLAAAGLMGTPYPMPPQQQQQQQQHPARMEENRWDARPVQTNLSTSGGFLGQSSSTAAFVLVFVFLWDLCWAYILGQVHGGDRGSFLFWVQRKKPSVTKIISWYAADHHKLGNIGKDDEQIEEGTQAECQHKT